MSASHQGPCLGYMAPLESNGEGDVWFKIYEEGWNKETKKWCTNKVIDNDGKLDITIPKDIPDGDYLVRTELIALHQAKQTGGAQLYPNCVVITVAGGTATALPKGYAIPGIYKPEDKGILYDRASDPSSYEIPGPPLFTGSSSGKSNTPAASNNDSESSSKAPVASKNEPAISMHVEPSTSAAEEMLAATLNSHLSSIKAQDIELGTIDIATFGANVDGMSIYKNTMDDKEFMSIDRITDGLYKVIAKYYPIVVGRPSVGKNGKGVIVVDPDNLCMPDIAELKIDLPAEHFFETRNYKKGDTVKFFNLRKFFRDSGISKFPESTFSHDHSAAIVRLIRFKDSPYVALYISLPHMIFDGTALTAFLNNWAECTRNLDNPDYKLQYPPINDRKVVSNYFDTVTAIEPPHTKHFKDLGAESLVKVPSSIIASLLFSAPDIPVFEEQHLLHFTAEMLELLRQDVDEAQTTNLALAALLTKTILQANIQTFNSMPTWSYVMFPYDCRQRAKVPMTYSGNLSFSAVAPLKSQTVLDGSYKNIALAIKEHCSKVSSEYAKSLIYTVENEIGVLFQAGISLCNSPDTSYVGLTNLRHMPMHLIDFGHGNPEILSNGYFIREGMQRIYSNKQDGGIDLFMNVKDDLFEYLKKSDELLKYADIIF
ncbi:hypothetical protein GGH12_004162 [Coemansia sp. RSA 1822]|nr:hypothetical protein LPJ76_003914 [Coemansia sp. RSA 638]KAJ2561255.1 hypothetical protein GGH12_004162 [Coemansia sp. RSA 1822]